MVKEINEEEITHFTLFSYYDHTIFKIVDKEEKWKKTTNDVINSIEKNNTWELYDLLKGQITINVK